MALKQLNIIPADCVPARKNPQTSSKNFILHPPLIFPGETAFPGPYPWKGLHRDAIPRQRLKNNSYIINV